MIETVTQPPTENLPDEESYVFIANTERVLTAEGPAVGNSALKVLQISPRDIWRHRSPRNAIVMPVHPGDEFVEYAAGLGWEPQIIVPENIDPQRIDICDGLADSRVQQAVRGRIVESYVADSTLYHYVRGHGGQYAWGNPDKRPLISSGQQLYGDTSHEIVNDKRNFRALTEGILDVPDGALVQGIQAIGQAIRQRLEQDGAAFVRNTSAGGGFGNMRFSQEDRQLTVDQITDKLTGSNPEIWKKAYALVEEYAPPPFSPALTMRVGGDGDPLMYHSLQLTREGDFVGMISPTPESILGDDEAEEEAVQLTKRLGQIGYYGVVGTDLRGELGQQRQRRIGYEYNGRMTGSMHPVDIGEGFWGDWHTWRTARLVTKAVDKFYLRETMDFSKLHDTLQKAEMLASREKPYGVVISIPPACGVNDDKSRPVAGIQILAQGDRDTSGYYNAEAMFQRTVSLIGDQSKNRYDDDSVGNTILE